MANLFIVTKSITRPADTTAYAANDAWADSDSAPTVGGFALTELAGMCGIITDLWLVSSNDPATRLQGELWLFDGAVTANNDNAAFALSDANALKGIGIVPFIMESTVAGSGTTSVAHVFDYQVGFDCTLKSALYYLVKVKNAYTPASGEVLTVRFKIERRG